MTPTCFLRQFAPPGSTCDYGAWGRPQRAHLIPKTRLKAAGLHDFEILWDTRIWRPACERHHHAFDYAKTIRLSLADYPQSVLDYATEHGFYWGGERDGWRAEFREAEGRRAA